MALTLHDPSTVADDQPYPRLAVTATTKKVRLKAGTDVLGSIRSTGFYEVTLECGVVMAVWVQSLEPNGFLDGTLTLSGFRGRESWATDLADPDTWVWLTPPHWPSGLVLQTHNCLKRMVSRPEDEVILPRLNLASIHPQDFAFGRFGSLPGRHATRGTIGVFVSSYNPFNRTVDGILHFHHLGYAQRWEAKTDAAGFSIRWGITPPGWKNSPGVNEGKNRFLALLTPALA